MQSTRARTAALHSQGLAVHETYRSVMVTQKAICYTENYYPSEASSRQSSLPGCVGRRSGLDWSGIHRLVAAVESACRRGSYWRASTKLSAKGSAGLTGASWFAVERDPELLAELYQAVPVKASGILSTSKKCIKQYQ